MKKATIVGLALACLVAAAEVFAHHDAVALGTARITHPVMVGDKLVEPGSYEFRLTGAHLQPLPGQSEEGAQEFALVRDGQVVASDYAEVMPGSPGPVGTSGANTRPRVALLRGGEFLRIAVNHEGERYLIHLPVAK